MRKTKRIRVSFDARTNEWRVDGTKTTTPMFDSAFRLVTEASRAELAAIAAFGSGLLAGLCARLALAAKPAPAKRARRATKKG